MCTGILGPGNGVGEVCVKYRETPREKMVSVESQKGSLFIVTHSGFGTATLFALP
jgi:hypothetical protein